jgi:hypothetical protein
MDSTHRIKEAIVYAGTNDVDSISEDVFNKLKQV